MPKPTLSIIVPVLNEAANLAVFLKGLALQELVTFEVVLCDGGSTDPSCEVVSRFNKQSPFSVRMESSPFGRARQMNYGAHRAEGDWLLFLHVDSCFETPRSLMLALAAIQREYELNDLPPCAGHFELRFERSDGRYPFAYMFYEAKTRLDFPDCIHGDQGFLMHRDVFERTGGFDESLTLLEDSDMADTISGFGRWILLPGRLVTSARRFESEGMLQRQILNALILNARQIGWTDFFNTVPHLYRSQDNAGKLDLLPVWVTVRDLFSRLTLFDRLHIWYATGRYVCVQAWQVLFAWHCYRQFRRGQVATMGRQEIQESMRGFERILGNPLGYIVTAVLVWFWFHLYYVQLIYRRRKL